MTATQIFTIARYITNTNSVTAPNTSLLSLLSQRNTQLVVQLSKIKEDYNIERSEAALAADQEEYLLPTDCIRLKRLELQWQTGEDWKVVTFYDINESNRANDATTIGNEFSTDKPYADVFDKSFFLRPIPTVYNASGLKLWYVKSPAELTTVSDEPDSPVEYHRLLADLLAIDIRQLKGDVSPGQALQSEAVVWDFLRSQVSPRVTDESMVIKPSHENYE